MQIRKRSFSRLPFLFPLFLFIMGCSSRSSGPAPAVPSGSDPTLLSQSIQHLVIGEAQYGPDVKEVYDAVHYSPAWLSDGHPTPQALALITAIQKSQQKGLKPEDYKSSQWAERTKAVTTATDASRAQFDVDLTLTAERFVSDLRVGRVSPHPTPFRISVGSQSADLAQFVRQSLASAKDVSSVLASAEPTYLGYKRTEAALQTYLALAVQDHSARLPQLTQAVSPGTAYTSLDTLSQRLRQLGDMQPGTGIDAAPGIYSGAVVEGVKHFQKRHGLAADGKLSRATIAQLNVPLSDRIVQLEDSLERWRWLPADYPELPVAVNIPEFVLRVFCDDHRIALRSNVVIGKAFGHQRPVFADEMKYIVFRPYWNVPLSITRAEIIPHILRDRGYFAHERLELTDQSGHVVTSDAVSESMLTEMRSGKLLVRQKPGPANSLGLIKFIFPNANNVYLHSMPTPQLFTRARRDFSHGCIRVEKPVELAAWLLRDQPRWTLDAVNAAMQSGPDNRQINLTRPIPVVIVYLTSVVEEDDEIYFFDDIYGLDHRLNTLLAKGPPYH